MNEKKGEHSLINLGAAPFLNMRPLIYPLEKGVVEHSFNIMYFDPFLLSEESVRRSGGCRSHSFG